MADPARWLRRRGRRLLFHSLRLLARAGGFARAAALGRLAGELEYRLAWRRRRRCLHDMALALGREPGDPWVAARLRRAHHVNGRAVLEILCLLDRRQDERALAPACEVEGLEHLHGALAGGRGAILLGAHMGNAVLLALRLAAAGLPVSVVYRQARMMTAGFFGRGFSLYGVDGILANEGIRAYGRMLAAVRKGRVVLVTIDQGVKRPTDGVVVRFLGKDMAMAAGPAQLARHARAPVLPIAALGADGPWRFRIEPPLAPATGTRPPLETEVERLARVSERQILAHPELWSWHHRRWHKLGFPPCDNARRQRAGAEPCRPSSVTSPSSSCSSSTKAP